MSQPKTFNELAIWKTGFDKGLSTAQQFLEVAKNEERERIIKLLGQTQSPSRFWGGIAWSIALIKGENK